MDPSEPVLSEPSAPTAAVNSTGNNDTTTKTRTRSQIGKANLAKSKMRERAVANWLRVTGFPGAERLVRTGFRVKGRESQDEGDITGTPGLAWQIKDIAQSEWWRIPGFVEETHKQATAAKADFGVLVVRRHGHGYVGEWWAHIRFCDLAGLIDPSRRRVDGPDALFPVRMELQHLVPLLRAAGYGSPLEPPFTEGD